MKNKNVKNIISHMKNMTNIFIGLSILSFVLILSIFNIGDINKTFKWLDKNFPIIMQYIGVDDVFLSLFLLLFLGFL